MTRKRFTWHLWHLLSEKDIRPRSSLAAEAALPICVMIWDEFQLLESCIKCERSSPPSVKWWQERQLCCSLFSLEICHRWLSPCGGQGSNVIVTIVSLLPTDWTCCRLHDWQIWGQQDQICRLSLRWQLFAYFVSISFASNCSFS